MCLAIKIIFLGTLERLDSDDLISFEFFDVLFSLPEVFYRGASETTEKSM